MQCAFGFSLSVFLLLPKYLAVNLGAGAFDIGLVATMFNLAALLCFPLVGQRIDHAGRVRLVTVGAALMTVGALGYVAVDRVGPLAAVLRAVHGIAWVTTFSAGTALAAELAPPERLAQVVGLYGTANVAMNAIAPAIAEPIADRFGYRWVFVIAATAGLASLLLGRRIREPPRHQDGASADLWTLLRRPPMPALAAVAAVTGTSFGVMFTYSGPFALARGSQRISGFFVAFTIGALLVRLVLGRFIDRIGKHRMTMVSLALYAMVVAATATLTPARLGGLGFAFGFAHGFFFPSFVGLLIERCERSARGKTLAIINGATSAGALAVIPLGLLAERVGYPSVFIIAGVATLAALGLLMRAVPR